MIGPRRNFTDEKEIKVFSRDRARNGIDVVHRHLRPDDVSAS
jgi:hypothetical protein